MNNNDYLSLQINVVCPLLALIGANAMSEDTRGHDVVVDFLEWYRRREALHNPLASYALDKCEETFRKGEWNSFGYWHAIYLRERPHHHAPALVRW